MKKIMKQAAVSLLAFFVLLVFLCFVDRAHIGVMGSEVGLASLNRFFFKTFGTSELFDTLSDVSFLLTGLYPIFFACVGLRELIEKKSIRKVHPSLEAFIPTFALMVVLYLIFTKVSPNYRPVLTSEGLEESFPSSHVMIAIVFSMTGLTMFRDVNLTENVLLKKVAETASFVLPCLVGVFRLLSGQHWFTDILGAVFLGVFLSQLHCALTLFFQGERS